MFGFSMPYVNDNKWDYFISPDCDNHFFKNYQALKGEAEYEADREAGSLYLYLLAADVTENMIFSSPSGQYEAIENSVPSYAVTIDTANWRASVYSGRYKFASDMLSKGNSELYEFRGFEGILMSENADFIDLITDNGSNKNYIKIMLNILAQDYLRGGRGIFEYVKRYCPDKNLSDGEYLDRALLSLSDPDRLYKAICRETEYILDENDFSAFADGYDRLAAKLMCRCAELGMKLKQFVSFRYMFVSQHTLTLCRKDPYNEYDNNDAEDFYERYGCAPEVYPKTEIPIRLAELIDRNTVVCGINYADLEVRFDCFKSRFMPVYFRNNTSEACELFEELEYIAVKFKEKYGYMMRLRASPIDLKVLDSRYADIIELEISQQAMVKIYNNKKLLKIILEKKFLSDNNIEALIKCCTEAIVRNKNNKNALITLHELNIARNKANK